MTASAPFDTRPSPEPDFVSAPFFDALARGELMIQQCAQCGRRQLGERLCNGCFAVSPAWTAASGRGVIHSWTVVHLPYHPAFDVPYCVVNVELEEGPRLLASLLDCDVGDVRSGMPVKMRPSRLATGVFVPVFVPAGAESRP